MIPKGRRADEVRLCADDCRYRKLYEGSQRSLTDMAARQAQAVSRVGRLRNQLVLAAKRAFPRAFGEAERAVGKRLSEVSDEVLVAYLESFMGSSLLAEEPAGLSELRTALETLGVPVPAGMDLAAWAEAVRRHGGTGAALFTSTPAITPRTVVAAPPRAEFPNRELVPAFTANPPETAQDLDDLFVDPVPAGAVSPDVNTDPAVAGPVTAPDAAPFAAPTAGSASPFEDDSADDGLLGDSVFDNGALDAFGDATPFGAESGFGGDFGDTFSTGDAFTGGSAMGDDPFPEIDDNPPTSSGRTTTSSSQESDTAPIDPVEHTDTPAAPALARAAAPIPVEAPPVVAAGADTPAADGLEDLFEQPAPLPAWASGRTVKPQLFPSAPAPRSGSRKERKPIRSRAIPAENPDVPVEPLIGPDGTVVLTDDLRQRLLAAASVARPVFTADLESLVGDPEVIHAWRQEVQTGELAVKFVLPKPRHRLRGSLVVPQTGLSDANAGFAGSWWARCMEQYRGAKIYELGVFFHRFAEQVISFENDGVDVISVRMSLPSGLTGALLVTGQDVGAGGTTREQIVTALERFMQDRLVHVAVLVTNAEQFESTAAAIEEEARRRGWVAAMPVTLSRSWEYVDGTGAAVPLLGV